MSTWMRRQQENGLTIHTPFQHHTESPSQCNKTKKEIKGIQIEKEKLKLHLLAEDIIA